MTLRRFFAGGSGVYGGLVAGDPEDYWATDGHAMWRMSGVRLRSTRQEKAVKAWRASIHPQPFFTPHEKGSKPPGAMTLKNAQMCARQLMITVYAGWTDKRTHPGPRAKAVYLYEGCVTAIEVAPDIYVNERYFPLVYDRDVLITDEDGIVVALTPDDSVAAVIMPFDISK